MSEHPAADGTEHRARGEIVALQILVLLFLLIRLGFQIFGGVLGDEAYYWMWGQHPGWSYFDHPPLHAWLLGLVSVFGWTPITVRLLTWASLAPVVAILWDWAGRLAPAQKVLWFWRALAIYLASPLFFVLTSSAYNDHLLVALSLLSVHCFARFTWAVETSGRRPNWWLLAAAAALGLAALAKYNAIFVGFGFLLAFLWRPRLRSLLATPWPWLAGVLAIAMQAPVLWWNLTEGGASFRYHLDDRWAALSDGLHWTNALRFVLLSLLFWSPFLVWPLVRLMREPQTNAFASAARGVAVGTLVASTVVLLITSIVLDAYFYWNIVAFVAVTPLLVSYTNRWLRILHYAQGLLWAGLIACNFSVMPIASMLGQRDQGTALNYHWDVVADRMRAQAVAHPEALLAATRYSTTSQLGFALHTTDVVKVSPEHSQWDYWQAERDFSGNTILILADEPDRDATIAYLREHFAKLDIVDNFDIEQFGRPIYRWRILLGTDWLP